MLDPPDVYDFAPHVEQAVDPATALYALSRPQFWQTISPAPENLPAGHFRGPETLPTVPDVPSQKWPAGQS